MKFSNELQGALENAYHSMNDIFGSTEFANAVRLTYPFLDTSGGDLAAYIRTKCSNALGKKKVWDKRIPPSQLATAFGYANHRSRLPTDEELAAMEWALTCMPPKKTFTSPKMANRVRQRLPDLDVSSGILRGFLQANCRHISGMKWQKNPPMKELLQPKELLLPAQNIAVSIFELNECSLEELAEECRRRGYELVKPHITYTPYQS